MNVSIIDPNNRRSQSNQPSRGAPKQLYFILVFIKQLFLLKAQPLVKWKEKNATRFFVLPGVLPLP